MNSAITNTRARTWQAVKANYLAAALGAALALSAVAGADSLRNVDLNGSPDRPATPASAGVRTTPPATTYYIVASQAEAVALGTDISEGASFGGRSEGVIVVLQTSEAEGKFHFNLAAARQASEAAGIPLNYTVVDLRGR